MRLRFEFQMSNNYFPHLKPGKRCLIEIFFLIVRETLQGYFNTGTAYNSARPFLIVRVTVHAFFCFLLKKGYNSPIKDRSIHIYTLGKLVNRPVVNQDTKCRDSQHLMVPAYNWRHKKFRFVF